VRDIRRRVLLGAAALTLTACSGAVTAPGAGASEVVVPVAQRAALAPSYGACDQVPAADMKDQKVEAALAESPELTTLSSLLPGLPLLHQSLAAEPTLLVFAPTNAAFDQLQKDMGEKAYQALLADKNRLDGLLSYHVGAKREAAADLVAAGKSTQLAYGDVTVGGTADALVLTSTNGTVAHVVCGNVQTANATVFVIDEVLVPKS
jgi:uncharacterized surface protein with fasciclin (FAS1) repeats